MRERAHPAAFLIRSASWRASARGASPFASARQPHIDKPSGSQRRAGFFGQRVGPNFAIAERFCSSREGAINHRARILCAVGSDARNNEPTLTLPHARRIARDANAKACAVCRDDLHREQAALQLRQMAMPFANLLKRSLQGDRRDPQSARPCFGSVRM